MVEKKEHNNHELDDAVVLQKYQEDIRKSIEELEILEQKLMKDHTWKEKIIDNKNYYLTEALQLYSQRSYVNAIEKFKRAFQEDPSLKEEYMIYMVKARIQYLRSIQNNTLIIGEASKHFKDYKHVVYKKPTCFIDLDTAKRITKNAHGNDPLNG